MRTRKAPASY